MAVRTAYAGAAVSGEVLTAANVNKIPGGWIGYNEVTANQTGLTTEVALTGLSVTVTVGTSRRVRVSVQAQTSSNSATQIALRIKEGATNLNQHVQNSGAGEQQALHGSVVLTPTAGSHTYNASLAMGTGSGDLLASATQPAYILVEDLGPAS